MSVWSGLAIYFVIWWTVLFAVLPFGVRSHHEAGVPVEPGHADAAPVEPMLVKKAIWTTIVAAVVFAAMWWVYAKSGLTLDDIPFMPKFREDG
ncbi:MAG: DUF1467 family protein [Hyphomicrobiales bacterium]